ncbi:MAG: mechanosensitive ion channel [Ardenticatenaceae bacterium]|nr:mechanosensitive ion channel [Ardenticatenaceae bacterium]
MYQFILNGLMSLGLDELLGVYLARAIMLILLMLVSVIAFYLTYRVLLRLLVPLAEKSATNWDDVLIKHRVIRRLAWLVPAGVFSLLFPIFFADGIFASWLTIINQLVGIYVVVMLSMAGFGFINATMEIVGTYNFAREIPLNGFSQLLKIVLVLIAGVLLIATAIGENPLVLLSGLGAFAAVLSFIYQDALRGLVAGIQLTSMGLLAVGDFVEVPAHGASGTVVEIGLTTIKIRNADFTVTTVPTAALISGSFKNWRGMQQSDGRRLKRAITIDLHSVQFIDSPLKERLSDFPAVHAYLEDEQTPEDPTNIGAFRVYVADRLANHPQINTDLTLMVRQLDPTPHGIPLELYAFSREKEWVHYEGILADIFDHIIAIAPQFDLRIYQAPQVVNSIG